MPKVSIYLPDALYAEVRGREIPVSAIAQSALEDAVRQASNSEWVARAQGRPVRSTTAIDTTALLDAVREEFGT